MANPEGKTTADTEWKEIPAAADPGKWQNN